MSALAAGLTAKVLVVTSFTEPTQVLPAIRDGAAGLVYKDIDPAALANAIRSVHSGHILLPPEVASALHDRRGGPDRIDHLTARERDVLAEIARAAPTGRSPASCAWPRRRSRPTCPAS